MKNTYLNIKIIITMATTTSTLATPPMNAPEICPIGRKAVGTAEGLVLSKITVLLGSMEENINCS